jgi:hypothetical protein
MGVSIDPSRDEIWKDAAVGIRPMVVAITANPRQPRTFPAEGVGTRLQSQTVNKDLFRNVIHSMERIRATMVLIRSALCSTRASSMQVRLSQSDCSKQKRDLERAREQSVFR